MSSSTITPVKTRELHNHHFDSTIWNDLNFRDDDIIISTYAMTAFSAQSLMRRMALLVGVIVFTIAFTALAAFIA